MDCWLHLQVSVFLLCCWYVHLSFCQQMLSGYFNCLYSSSTRMLCAAQQSCLMVKPGRIRSSIMVCRFSAGVLWTVTGNVLPLPLV
jgi:hypothetical protein